MCVMWHGLLFQQLLCLVTILSVRHVGWIIYMFFLVEEHCDINKKSVEINHGDYIILNPL